MCVEVGWGRGLARVLGAQSLLSAGSASQPICLGHVAWASWVPVTGLIRAFLLCSPTLQ